jgi:hypothetical protein
MTLLKISIPSEYFSVPKLGTADHQELAGNFDGGLVIRKSYREFGIYR